LISSDNAATGHTVLKVTASSAPLVKAAEFDGDVDVTGDFEVGGTADIEKITPSGGVTTFIGTFKILGLLTVDGVVTAGTKAFRIDHPLDDSKYLQHACIESDEMVNIYTGRQVRELGHRQYYLDRRRIGPRR